MMMLRRFVYPLALMLLLFACKTTPDSEKAIEREKVEQKSAGKEYISKTDLDNYKTKLSGYFDTMLFNGNFNGAILVARGGHILYESYNGYTDPAKKTDTITPHTAFHLASTSKPFTGVAVMKLVEQGKIGLDDDVIKYFSGFPYSGVTVSHLLTHRSGLPNYLYFMDDKQKWDQNRMVFNKDVLNFLVNQQPPKSYNPGIRFNYCNTNYVLLALIVEKVTGQSFPQYLKETIFDPLGMKDTYVYTRPDSARSIMSYKPSGALWANDKYEYTYGDKNIYSTPRDMFRWDSALYREDFISKAILDSSFIPRSNERPSIHNYGYGWRMLNLKNGKNVIYHFGKWHGFTPAFSRLVDEKAVIVILGNRYSQRIYEAAKHSYDIFGNYMQTDPAVDEDDIQPTGPVNENQLKDDTALPQSKKPVKPAEQKKVPVAPKKTTAAVPKKTKATAKTSTKSSLEPVAKPAVKTTSKTNAKTASSTTIKKKVSSAPVTKKTSSKTVASKTSTQTSKTAAKKKVSRK